MKKSTKHAKKPAAPPKSYYPESPTVNPTYGPIKVQVSDPERMRTIQTIANALYELAKQIGKPMNVTVQNCTILGAETGIHVEME